MIIFLNLSQHNPMKFEADLIRFFQSNMNSTWITIFQIISMFGSLLGFISTFFIVYLKRRSLSYAFFVSYFTFQILNRVLKHFIARNRPFVEYDDILNFDNESGYSFPSGHSLSAGMFVTYLAYTILKSPFSTWDKSMSIIFLVLLACSVMLSRMALGAHYLTDTIVGLILGILFAIISILVYNITVRKLAFKRTSTGDSNGRNIVSGDQE